MMGIASFFFHDRSNTDTHLLPSRMVCERFPFGSVETTARELSHPSDVIVHSTPLLLSGLTWIVIEAARRGTTVGFRRFALLTGVVASASAAGLTWRVFDILDCQGHHDDVAEWQWAAVIVSGVSSTVMLLVAFMYRRFVRAAALLSLVVAAGAVFADWALRGGLTDVPDSAATPLVAVQQTWCLQAIALLAFLGPPRSLRCGVSDSTSGRERTGRSRGTRRHENGTNIVMVDPLTSTAPPTNQSTKPGWTWFS